jgi:tRNA modification GTPase
VIRVSGSDAFLVCDTFFRGKITLSEAVSHTIHYGRWVVDGRPVDTVTASVFRAPHSYTGENVVEISCHGGTYMANDIIASLLTSNARLAQPGEFTRRAFLNRKLDLTQAEAVADIIHAESHVGVQTAARQLSGGFTRRLSALRQRLLDVIGLLELELDFSEEDVEFVDRTALRATVMEIVDEVEATASTAHSADVLRSGYHVAVVGYPNVGKSSIFNALLGRERAIVSDVEGTTRDYISEAIILEGYAVHLVDTAGIRKTNDTIELRGISLTRSLVEQSDLVLVVNDGSRGLEHSSGLVADLSREFPSIPIVVIHNKADLAPRQTIADHPDSIFCSAHTGEGLRAVTDELVRRVRSSTAGISDVLVNQRQAHLLRSVANHLRSALTGMDRGLSSDFLAVDLRAAIRLMGDISGESWNPDVLDTVFSRFCIGK